MFFLPSLRIRLSKGWWKKSRLRTPRPTPPNPRKRKLRWRCRRTWWRCSRWWGWGWCWWAWSTRRRLLRRPAGVATFCGEREKESPLRRVGCETSDNKFDWKKINVFYQSDISKRCSRHNKAFNPIWVARGGKGVWYLNFLKITIGKTQMSS